MAKRIIIISSFPVCIILAVVAIVFVGTGQGQANETVDIDSARSQIIALADAGNLTEIDKVIDKFITDYSESGQLHSNLLTIADSFAWRRLYDKANRLYQNIIDKSSDSFLITKSNLGLNRIEVLNLIGQKKYSVAQKMVDTMVINFKEEPDLGTALFQVGQEFFWQRRFIESEEAFNKGIKLFPFSPAAKEMKLWSTRANICSLIWQRKDEQVVPAIDKMINDFNGDVRLPDVLYWISKEYEWAKSASDNRSSWYDAPNSVYQRLFQHFNYNEADWDYKRLNHRIKIFKLIKESKQDETEADIDKLVTEFAGRPELAGELRWIAIGYEENPQMIHKAKEIYNRIIKEYPGTIEANNSILDSRRIDIVILFKADNEKDAELLLEKYVYDFNSYPYAGPCLKSMAWEFRNEYIENIRLNQTDKARVYFERAIKIWNIIVDKLPANPYSTPESLYFIGKTYSQMGECEKGIPYLKRVVTDWPDYQFAYRADTEIANCLGKTANK